MDIVLYHADCVDGFGAYWAYYHCRGSDVAHEAIPVYYDKTCPLLEDYGRGLRDISDVNLYILDFCYPLDVMRLLKERCESIVLIDHHASHKETAIAFQADLGAIECTDRYSVIFSTEHSGAVLTWEWLQQSEPVPRLLRYVEDRDLWQWRLPFSRELNAAIRLESFSISDWDILKTHFAELPEDVELAVGCGTPGILRVGQTLVRMQDEQVARLIKDARPYSVLGVGVIMAVNAPRFMVSNTCSALLKAYPDIPIAMAFHVELTAMEHIYHVELRSRPGGPDVGEIAKRSGGGGHPNAAGYVWRLNKDASWGRPA